VIHAPELPLFRRELVAMLRTRRAFWLLVGVVVVSRLIPLMAWLGNDGTNTAEMNAAVFTWFVYIQIILCIVVIPAFAAGAVSGERERNTYDLLFTTLLSPTSIALSKVGAATTYVLLLLLAPIPMAAVLHLFGGITFGPLLKVYAVTLAGAVSCALVTLTVSLRCERTASAVVRAILWVLLWQVGVHLAAILVVYPILALSGRPTEATIVTGLSPFATVTFELLLSNVGPVSPLLPPWLIYLVYAGAVSASHLAYILTRIRDPNLAGRRRSRRARSGQPHVRRRPLSGRALESLARRGVRWLANPVFLKEIHTDTCGKVWCRRVVFWLPLLLGLLFLVYALVVIDREGLEVVWGVLIGFGYVGLFLMFLIVPAASAGAFPREFEQGSLDLLRGTFLSSREVLAGKFLGAVYSGVGIVAAAGWMAVIAGFFDPDKALATAVVTVLVFGLSLTFTAVLTTCLGALCRRSSSAVVLSYLILIALVLILPALLMGSLRSGGSASPLYVYVFSMLEIWNGDAIRGSQVQPSRGVFAAANLIATLGLWWLALFALRKSFSGHGRGVRRKPAADSLS